MNPLIVLLLSVAVGLVLLLIPILARRPEGGWIAHFKAAAKRPTVESAPEAVDVTIHEILASAPTGSAYLRPNNLREGVSALTGEAPRR